MKVLIFGATGFLGRKLIDILINQKKITFFKNKNDLLQNNGIFFSLLAIKYAHQITYEE